MKIKKTHNLTLYASVVRKTVRNRKKKLTLPSVTTFGLLNDPKQIGFRMARHKFVSKMLGGARALEIGCQEGFTSLFVASSFRELVAIDFYPAHIRDAKKYIGPYLVNTRFQVHDILKGPVPDPGGPFEAAFCMDVLEHIKAKDEKKFFQNMCASLLPSARVVIGMPSKESQVYASTGSKMGHVNCKSGAALKQACEKYFEHVFLFSMNDEVIHTGFYPMAHYLIAVCCNAKNKKSFQT